MRQLGSVALLLLAIATSPGARADDVTDQINEALKAWQAHDAPTAIAALDAAAGLLRRARAEGLKNLLPPVPPGWTADPSESTAVAVAMLGGGTTASRRYHNASQSVDVRIIADSPMLQGIAGLLGGPLAAFGGLQTVVINGRRMSYAESDNSYTTLVADKIIVKVSGGPSTPDPTLRSFIGAIDFAAVEKAR